MPTYQYQCLNCEHRFELKQSFSARPIAVCPICHGVANRLFTAVPILFKGPGFYITDSREEREHSFDAKGLKGKEREK
jgi:putative FmdB family regulatory protein